MASANLNVVNMAGLGSGLNLGALTGPAAAAAANLPAQGVAAAGDAFASLANSAFGESSSGDNGLGISRNSWSIESIVTSTPIAFNVNPSSVSFQFVGRGSSQSGAKGRLISRFKANGNTGYFDLDIQFDMQTGSLMGTDAAPGHKVLMGILAMMNEDIISDGQVNYQTLKLSTSTFGNVTAKGFLDIQNMTIAEAAEDPFKAVYSLTFHAFETNPPLTSSDQLIKAVTVG